MIELPESRIKSWFNNRRAKLRKSINSVDSSNSDEGVHEEVTGDDSSSVSDNNGNTKLPVDEEKEDTKDVVDNHIDGGEFYENISLERDNDCLKISEENERVRIDSEDRKTVKVTEGIPASYVEDVFSEADETGDDADSDLDAQWEEKLERKCERKSRRNSTSIDYIQNVQSLESKSGNDLKEETKGSKSNKKRKLVLIDGEEQKKRRVPCNDAEEETSERGKPILSLISRSINETTGSGSKKKENSRKRRRCGACGGCMRANCGDCVFCLDMTKFGGPGKMKQACEKRACLEEEEESAELENGVPSSGTDTPAKAKEIKFGGSDKKMQGSEKRTGLEEEDVEAKRGVPIADADTMDSPAKTTKEERSENTEMTPNTKKKRGKRCKECEGCLAANCGECVFCLDMPRFGGPGRMKQACEKRACVG